MAKLGDYITISNLKNADGKLTLKDVKGVSIKKEIIETKADMTDVSLKPYLLVKPDYFVYVTVTSRNGEKITLAHNDTDKTYLMSSSYVVFYVSKPEKLDSDYLFMCFNRPEFDRYTRFNSWGSARETFLWDDMCDIDLTLPDLSEQRRFVAVYKSLLANQRAYERGLDDLKLTCGVYIENLRRHIKCEAIGKYIEECTIKNEKSKIKRVQGVSIEKKFIETKAQSENLNNYLIVKHDAFAFVPTTSRNGGKITIALNQREDEFVVSSSYTVFEVKNREKLLPEYLFIWLSRPEFDRYARFHSWGSARETFSYSDMQEVEIPIPDINVQRCIVDIYNACMMRKEINERLKRQIKDICPVLIRGSLEKIKR